MPKYLLFFGISLSLIIRAFFILNGSEIADIHALKEMGEIVLKGENPYLVLNYNTYPPLALYIQTLTIQLAEGLNTPFYILIKLWPNIADFLTAGLIFWFTRSRIWSLVFLLNPVSIIISAAHGQLDSIPTFLSLSTILILQTRISTKNLIISGFLFALAIAIKPNPLIILPIILFYLFKKTKVLEKAIFVFFTFLPLTILLYPFLQGNVAYILDKLFNYTGSSDFGLAAILRTNNFYQNAILQLPNAAVILYISKNVFLALMILILILQRQFKSMIRMSLIIYLLFLTIYFGISAQYLSWVLVFAALQKDKMIIPYTIFGLIALVGFYFYFNPTILLQQFSNIPAYNPQFLTIYALGNLLFWGISFFWLIKSYRLK